VKAVLDGGPVVSEPFKERIELRIQVPASVYQWKASRSGWEQALAIQIMNRRKFQQAFSQGLAVLGFSLDTEGNGVYELGFPTPSEVD
jgi:hypothetical protein